MIVILPCSVNLKFAYSDCRPAGLTCFRSVNQNAEYTRMLKQQMRGMLEVASASQVLLA